MKLGPNLPALTLAVAALPAGGQVVQGVDALRFPPLAAFDIPQPATFTLPNGMQLFLLEDHELPLIEARALIRTGTAWDPADKAGLARLTGEVMRTGGAGPRTGDEIDDLLEARAASVESSISDTAAVVTLSCLREDFETVVEVLRDVLVAPRFAEDKLELARLQVETEIARRNDDVGDIAAREFGRLVYGEDSPLAREPEYATVRAIGRDDLVAFHGRYFHPDLTLFGVVGDFDAAGLRRTLEGVFGGWPRGPEVALPPIPYRKEAPGGTYLVEKPDVAQATLRLGHLGITYDNPDLFAVTVMNEVLGGGFASRLVGRIRTAEGLAYSVGGGVRASYLTPGLTVFGLETRSDAMGKALDALRRELRRMLTEPPSDAEVQQAKDAILNSFVFNYATRSQILRQQLRYAFYGLPADFLERYRERVEKVSRDDVARVAARYLHPERMTVLVVGNPADFDRPVEALGEVTRLDIRIPPPPSNGGGATRRSHGPRRTGARAAAVQPVGVVSPVRSRDGLVPEPNRRRKRAAAPRPERFILRLAAAHLPWHGDCSPLTSEV